ncbi:MAG: response regulator [Magnetococcales bacterium]|nr:response regulator [Magnetococcales bacterium]
MAHILVMDDDPGILALVREALKEEGHEVFIALNGREGLEIFQRHSIQLVLTDIFMPELDGLGAMREILALAPQTRFIAFTGEGKEVGMDTFALNTAVRTGAHAVLEKPFGVNELVHQVETVLRG